MRTAVILLIILLFGCAKNEEPSAESDHTAEFENLPELSINSGEEQNNKQTDEKEETNNATAEIKETADEPGLIAGQHSKYYEWDAEKFKKAREENKTILLEFTANWCGECAKEENALKEGFKTLSENTSIIGFKIHYNDDEMSTSHKELAKTFGVSYPNTKIIIKNRIIARKSIEEWDKEKFLMEIEKIG